MRRLALIGLAAVFLTGCGSASVFNPKSAYPPDPWVKGYSDPDDCIGGEKLAAVSFELPDYPTRAFRGGRQGWTIIRLDVAASGETENVRIERSVPDGLFDGTSKKAAEGWRFRPPAEPLYNCRVLLRYRAGKVTLGS
ncbi:energy transducer TonB [Litorimonas sp. WD9-15]|uniref:energy transducer TonB n=1 Tax=Litorimonas sp. WD9-15 TaxID=3418716 RepID=UPI003D063617